MYLTAGFIVHYASYVQRIYIIRLYSASVDVFAVLSAVDVSRILVGFLPYKMEVGANAFQTCIINDNILYAGSVGG